MPRFVFILVFVLAAAGVLGWLGWKQSQRVPLVVSGFIEAEAIRVGSRVGGRVAEVLVDEGYQVQPGDILFRIAPFDLQQRHAEAQSRLAALSADLERLKRGNRKEEIEQARARRDRQAAILDKLVAGPRPAEIEVAREALKLAQANLKYAETEHDRVMALQQGETAAKIEMAEAVRLLSTRQAEVEKARQSLALLEEGTRKEEIAEARAQLAEAEQALALMEEGFRKEDIESAAAKVAAAQAEVAAIGIQLDELQVQAPCNCVVEAIDLNPGDLVSANAPAVSLLDLNQLWVRTYVPEARLGQIALQDQVPVRVDGFPNRTFRAHVAFIAREAEFTPRNVQTPEERSKLVFRVKVVLDEGLRELRAGMSADVLFDEASSP